MPSRNESDSFVVLMALFIALVSVIKANVKTGDQKHKKTEIRTIHTSNPVKYNANKQ